MDQHIHEAAGEKNNLVVAWTLYLKMATLTMFGDYENASEVATQLSLSDTSAFPPFVNAWRWLYEGIIALSLPRKRHGLLRSRFHVAKHKLKQLKSLTNHSSRNFISKVYFMEAEILAAQGQEYVAVSRYIVAASAAESCGYLGEEAMALERSARLLYQLGNFDEAQKTLEKSRACFQSWGAQAKVDQLSSLPYWKIPTALDGKDDGHCLEALTRESTRPITDEAKSTSSCDRA